jgi:hypothetical protein
MPSNANAAAARGRKAIRELQNLYAEKAIANASGFQYPAFRNLNKYWMGELKAAKTSYYNAKAKSAK